MSVVTRLEYELSLYNIATEHVSHYATKTGFVLISISFTRYNGLKDISSLGHPFFIFWIRDTLFLFLFFY